MIAFGTAKEAQAFVSDIIDIPTEKRFGHLMEGVNFSAFPQELNDGRFTNIYDVCIEAQAASPKIHAHSNLTSVYDLAKRTGTIAATGGGFFYLADVGSSSPRQLALNLAMADHRVHSLPVSDKEAIVSDGQNLSAKKVQALGLLSLNGNELSWSGSLTSYETDVKIFGNGNVVISHELNEATGSARVLNESSRFTSNIDADNLVDIGFIGRPDGVFTAHEVSRNGEVDIFAHDMVVRCDERYLAENQEMMIRTIGDMAVGETWVGALSVGPLLQDQDFDGHPINVDRSLGARPPFLEKSALARTVVYGLDDGTTHVRLFDGRPGSEIFTGVTPAEAVEVVDSEGDIAWGCFLDGGQTTKLCVDMNGQIESVGNRHYLKWATQPGEKYIWVPDAGRPTGSAITL